MQMNEQVSAQQVVLMPVAALQSTQPKRKQKKEKKEKKNKNKKTALQSEEVQVLRDDVTKYSSRIHITGILLVAIGTIGVFVSMYKAFNARHIAIHKLQGKDKVSTKLRFHDQQFISADMFSLVDGIRIVYFLTFLLSMFVISLGKIGLKSTYKLKSKASNRIFKKSLVKIAFIGFLLFATRHYIKENKAIVNRHNKPNETPIKKDRKLAAFREEDDLEAVWEKVNADIQERANAYKQKMEVEAMPIVTKKEEIKQLNDVKEVNNNKKHNKKHHGKHKKAARKAARKAATKAAIKSAKKSQKTQEKGAAFDVSEYVKNMENKMTQLNPKQEILSLTEQIQGHFGEKYQKKYQRRLRSGRKPCRLIGALFVILVISHLYQVKHLAQSLVKLENFGVNVKKEKKANKKHNKVDEPIVANDEEISEIAPAEMNYSFDSMTDENVQFEFPVIQQPAPTYIINDKSHQMC